MTGEMYFGSPGSLIEIPHPRGGVQTTRVRPTSTFQTASGGARTGKTLNGKRRFTLNWRQLWYETYASLTQYDQGHMGPGPFALHDPSQINWLRVNQSSATSLRNDPGEFTLVTDQTAMYDNYTRTGTGGWGTATSGHVWVASTPTVTPFSTDGTTGKIALSSVIAAASSYGGMYLPGSAGAYASTPDNAALDITGDIDLRADVTIDAWQTPAVTTQFVGKWNDTGNQRSYVLQLAGGLLQLVWSNNGTTVNQSLSTTAVPVSTGRLAVRATMDVDNGAGGNTITFYTASTMAGPWTQLGLAVVNGFTTSIFNSTAVGQVDGINAAGSARIYVTHAAEIRNGIGGTVVANPDFDAQAAGTTSFADSAGRTWTLNGTASVVSGYAAASITSIGTRNTGLRLPGISGSYASTPDAAALDITSDIDLRADVTLSQWNPGVFRTLIAKYLPTGNQKSYGIGVNNEGRLSMFWSNNGSADLAADSTDLIPVTAGRLAVRATLDVDNGAAGKTVTFYTAPTNAGPWTQLGNPVTTAGTTSIFASTAVLEVGTDSGGTADLLRGLVHAAEVRSGIGGTAVANPDFSAQAGGTSSFADAAGRTWTVNGSAAIASGDVEWDLVTDISLGITPAGGDIAAGIDLPFLADATTYRAWLTFTTLGTVKIGIFKRKDTALTTIVPGTTLSSVTTATATIRMRVRRAEGRFQVRVWDKNLTEPTTWTASFADTTTIVPGTFRVVAYRLIGNSNSSAVVTFDNLTLTYIDPTSSLSSSAVLVDRGPRSLAWTLGSAFTDITGTVATLILDSPSPSWPGIPVITGLPLMFSFTARGGGSDPIVTLTPQLTWYNSAGVVISTTSGTPVATSSGAWSVVSVTATPPGGAAYVLAKVEFTSGESGGSIVYMDRFQMERGSTITTWRPGTGIMPVTIMSLNEQWPWMASDYRENPVMVLQEVGA